MIGSPKTLLVVAFYERCINMYHLGTIREESVYFILMSGPEMKATKDRQQT